MIRSGIYTLVLAMLSISVTAQNGNFYDSNNTVLTQNRYDKVGGSPYLLSDWSKGTLYPIKGEPIPHQNVNFNGATNKFDIVEGESLIQLNAALYNKVDLMQDGKTYHFVNRLSPDDLTYYLVLHQGEDYLFLEHFESDLRSQGANYGVSADKEKFINRTQYYIWKDGQLHDINRNTNKIIEFFGSAALKKEVKSKKLNLKKDEDLTAALSFYDQRQAKKKDN